MHLRHRISAADRGPLQAALVASGVFTPHEVRLAVQIIDDSLARPESDEYRFVVAELAGVVVGYACWGTAPCTEGVYDVYWIVVHPEHQGRQVGRGLLEAVEAAVRDAGGRMLLIDTASKPEYAPTRRFYARLGYREAAILRDYYRVGDDKIVFEKRFSPVLEPASKELGADVQPEAQR